MRMDVFLCTPPVAFFRLNPRDVMRRLLPLFLFMLWMLPVRAQVPLQTPKLRVPAASPEAVDAAPARAVHVTDRLVASPEGQAALRAFHAAKAAGRLPQRKAGAAPCTIGQTRTFNVLKDVVSSSIGWVPKTFECKASNNLASVWVETSQLGVVSQADLEALETALLSSTPAGSFDPDQGIIANDEAVFGSPPNFDGDGVVDVLLYDVTEGPDADEGVFVLGFFSPTDINPNAGPGQGNQADVLYLDTNPQMTEPGRFGRGPELVRITAAHEYQHLIHANYDLNEITFVNEAQSEWAEYMNGYQGRFITYLNDVAEHNTSFLTYRENGLIDRQRGSLFTNYVAEQVGALTAGAITRDPGTGIDGYNNVLGAEAMRTLLADFHTANLLNDVGVDPRYGYSRDNLKSVRAVPAEVIDGRAVFETPATTFMLTKGGVRYIRWEDVGDFILTLDALPLTTPPIGVETVRTWLRPRVILEHTDGTVEVVPVTLPAEAQVFAGPLAALTLVVPHVELGGSALPASFQYEASWTASGAGLTTVAVVQDDGNVHVNDDNGNGWIFTTGAGAQGAVANRVEVPSGTVALDRVLIAPFFENQFGGSSVPSDAPRDVAVTVWADDNGRPGTELFSLVQNLGNGYFAINLQTPCALTSDTSTAPCPISNFWSVDLSAYQDPLSNLPDVIWVGYKETGTDVNYMVIVPSRHPSGSVSWVRLSAGNWAELWSLGLSNGASLRNASIPIRAEFLVDTATPVEDEIALPERVVLEPNHPNPFNPVTTLAYQLDRPAEVRLAVYDVLGREVTVLAEGLQPAGRHEVVFEARGLPSGLYFYRLQTPTRTLTRTMMLLR